MPSPSPYGADHRRRRKLAIQEAYGTPCPLCGEPMLKGQNLDFAHADEDLALNPSALATQMQHADYRDCPAGGNRAEGGRLGRRMQDLAPSRVW